MAKYASITAFTVNENRGNVDGINFTPVLGSGGNKLRYINPALFLSIKKSCQEKGIKHVIIEHPYYAWLGYALKKYAGLKLIIHSHNIEAARFKSMRKWWWRIMHHYEKFAHRHADFNFFITEEDKNYAVKEYGLDAEKCTVITYGIEADKAPDLDEKQICKKKVCDELNLSIDTNIILFNGTLDYAPNRDGLDRILNEINPHLLQHCTVPYKIVICGLRLPESYNGLKAFEYKNIIYKGFVEDIDLYFKSADLFMNPITDGGGIKTKLVEALGANTPAVSFKAGAYGVPLSVTGNHLALVKDADCLEFAKEIITKLQQPKEAISPPFFEHFSWDKIARRVISIMTQLVRETRTTAA
ncbi:glycosyltransferase family 4 protein [Niabella ginsengisoli]|uniref:Glycosyltransferase family 4 protein n=1 Tax=Niabella ginsengisoli TaxID=522298 RepID=A0ABS9SER6_9BACT|nr:glycosyltransferase family 4 protein [Niabella ginsengisoli]MCH5596830.1 glycosyltransferase family 4 protein [Niabella ginsengisoli]